MANIWFCSDLHLGHKNIGKFRYPYISSTEENNEVILNEWIKHVTKRDHVYVLGDFCFDKELFDKLDLPGEKKYLVRGNHDNFQTSTYLKFFNEIYGIVKYKEFWLSHAPVHPEELRGKVNLHGHVHYATIKDDNYVNCCPENLWAVFGRSIVSLDEIRKHLIFRRGNVNT